MENPLTHADFLTAEAPREAAIRFRRTIVPDQPRDAVVSARLVATALGVYEARLDGAPVSDSVLDPGWNAYEWRLPFQTWDVTDAVRGGSGDLTLDVLVGNG